MEPEPCETLYIQNLNEKIKCEELKILLYQLCAQYGSVLEVVAQRRYRMRGQAFVVYDSVQDATHALRVLQGYYFYGKPMKVSFARAKSDVIAKRQGLLQTRDPEEAERKRTEFFEKLKAKQTNRKGQRIELPINGLHASNTILVLDSLSPDVGSDLLQSLFELYPGFRELRMIPGKLVAFVEYGTSQQASNALVGLSGYKLTPAFQIHVSYAKR